MLTANACPLLRSDVSWHADSRESMAVRILARDNEYAMEGQGVGDILPVLARLNGERTLASLADDCGLSPRHLAQVLDPLVTDDLVLDTVAAIQADSVAEFRHALQRECRFWYGVILAQPFWQQLLSGAASQAMVLGWGVEFMHFANAANEYMAAGVAFCREAGDVRESVARHYVEESGHGEIFKRGLVNCGLPDDTVANAVPLPTTRALINHLWEVALENGLAYGATFNLMQSAEVSRMAADEFCKELCRLYPGAKPLFLAFQQHTEIDVGLRHDRTVFDQLLDAQSILDLRAKQRVVAAVRDLAEYFCAFFEGLRRYYGLLPAFAVRRSRSSAFLEHVRGDA